ncbi:MAG TPA: cobalamin-binding protein [Planctomycetaceae bacterium]|nr:cobalamin-binding protein [Planctomycetaceae bacterium]
MQDLQALTEAIKVGNRADATRITQEHIDAGTPARAILDALIAGMDDVGRRFKANEIFVPEVLIAARAMKESMERLEPLLVKEGIQPEFTAVIGTVQGDLHDIGKNLVAMMWRGANIGVIDLGTNVQPDKFVQAVQEHGAKLVGLSALLTTTMPAMQTTIDAIRSAGLGDVKVVIGGAPVTEDFADRIGADGYAPDAATAVEVAKKVVAV